MLSPGWFSLQVLDLVSTPTEASLRVVPPIRPGGLNQKVLPDQDEDWK
jgi:hypothetical protein